MLRLLALATAATLFPLLNDTALGQTVVAQYLQPGHTPAIYDYVRFGSSAGYQAGFMHNKTNGTYGNGDDFTIFTYYDRDLSFYSGAGHIVFNQASTGTGNVGIGTATPTYKLDVNGTARAKEVIVESTGADFVFEPDYRLRPLAEVEAFIQEHGHLPEVPSAAEMQAEGMRVGELQTTLLQKVEEFTLYLLQQQEKNETLLEMMQEQQAEISWLRAELQALRR